MDDKKKYNKLIIGQKLKMNEICSLQVNKLFFMTQHLFQLLIDENRRQINQISHVANVFRNIFS